MNSTLSLIINVPTLFLLYLLTYFTQSLSGKRQFYGISLNYEYFKKEEFKNLDKKYKLYISISFMLSLVLQLLLIYIFHAYVISSIIPFVLFFIFTFLIYLNIHNKVKKLKSKLSLNINNLDLDKNKAILDTDFIQSKNKIVKKYSIIILIPFIVTSLIGIYALANYNIIPNTIPTHWGASGIADGFSDKSFIKILAIVGMVIGISLIIYISSIYSLKARAKLSADSIDNSKKVHLHHLNMFGITFLLLNISLDILFISIIIATINASNLNTLVLWLPTILMIFVAIYQVYLYYKSPNKSKSASYSVDDDDNFWILGFIYNNPDDPSIFVNKRFGAGWTVNIGSNKGKIFFILPFIIILLSLIFI